MELLRYLLISLPEALIFLFFSLALFGIDCKSTWKQGLLHSVIYSVGTIVAYQLFSFDFSVRLLLNSILFFILLKLLFALPFIKSVFITIVRMISQIMIEMVFIFSYVQVTQKSFQDLAIFPDYAISAWCYFIVTGLLTYYFNKKQINLPNIFKLYRQYNMTILLWVWAAILIVITVNSIFMAYVIASPTSQFTIFTMVLVFVLPLLSAILGSYMVFNFFQNMTTLTMRQTEEVYLEYLDELITHFRSQRHDFLNHMQVVYGFAKIGNLNGILRYLEDLNLEAEETLSLLQLKHPPMAALLRAKAATAIVKQVQFEVQVKTSLDKLTIRPFELVKVIGNIIDNAFDEEIKAPEQQRRVEVSIEREHPSYISIHIFNRNSYISPEEQSLIFRQGYTSKEDHHTGTGLAICKQIVQRYSGEITIWSEPEQGTRFTVTLPVKNRGHK